MIICLNGVSNMLLISRRLLLPLKDKYYYFKGQLKYKLYPLYFPPCSGCFSWIWLFLLALIGLIMTYQLVSLLNLADLMTLLSLFKMAWGLYGGGLGVVRLNCVPLCNMPMVWARMGARFSLKQ